MLFTTNLCYGTDHPFPNLIFHLILTHSLDFDLKGRLLNSLDQVTPPLLNVLRGNFTLPLWNFHCCDFVSTGPAVWFMPVLCRLQDTRGQSPSLFVLLIIISIKMKKDTHPTSICGCLVNAKLSVRYRGHKHEQREPFRWWVLPDLEHGGGS